MTRLQGLTDALLVLLPGLRAVPLQFWHASRAQEEHKDVDPKYGKWSIEVNERWGIHYIPLATGGTPEECLEKVIRGLAERSQLDAKNAAMDASKARARAENDELLVKQALAGILP